MTTNTQPAVEAPQQDEPAGTLLDFDSDLPLQACPLRNNGDEICEACQ